MPSAVETKSPETPSPMAPVVIDLGRKRKKRVKQLREGRGKIMDQVSSIVSELRANGTIGASAQPLIIVVREKQDPMRWPLA
jgi:hypothetical protein